MRLRKLINFVLIGIIVFITIALLINFIYIPTTKKFLNEIDLSVKLIEDLTIEINLPVKVLENISQIVTEEPTSAKKSNLIEAFNRNKESLNESFSLITLEVGTVADSLLALDKISSYKHHSIVASNDRIIVDILKSINQSSIYLSSSDISNSNINEIKNHTAVLSEKVEMLTQMENKLNESMLSELTIVINMLFTILVVFLIALSLGIYKYVSFDQEFVLKSFDLLEEKKFDFELLPKSYPVFLEEIKIHNRIKALLNDERFNLSVKNEILNAYHIDDLIERLFNVVSKTMYVDRVGVAFVDYSNRKIIAEYGKSSLENVKLGPGFEVPFEETSLTDILFSKKAIITQSLNDAFTKNPDSPSLKLITEEGMKSNLIVPLFMGDIVSGIVFFSSTEENCFNDTHRSRAERMISEISGYLNRSYFTKVIMSKIATSFAALVDKKDNETGGHISRMVSYSLIIAEGLLAKKIQGYEICQKFVLEIERNASSHDIGKVAIPDSILKKPGKLSIEEWQIMKTHTTEGADIFKSLRAGLKVFESDFYQTAEEIARYHHEKWDGSGYPEGLTKDLIPLSARIVALGDVFDALTSKRHYKEAYTFEESVDIIKQSSGSHFDPILVDVFLENIQRISKVYEQGKADFI